MSSTLPTIYQYQIFSKYDLEKKNEVEWCKKVESSQAEFMAAGMARENERKGEEPVVYSHKETWKDGEVCEDLDQPLFISKGAH